MNSNLLLLALCQGLFLTNNVTFIAINGLVGFSLAPVGWMATLPVMGYVVGGALSTGLVAKSQAKWGRRISFQLGLLVGLLSAILCAFATFTQHFALLVLATFVAGYYSANGQLYRFAAAELAEASFREKAVSWVMAGGLIGAIVGPNLASHSKGWFETPFMGAYVALTAVAILGMVLMHFVKFPPVVEKVKGTAEGRPLSEIMKQPVFIVAAGHWHVCAWVFHRAPDQEIWHAAHHGGGRSVEFCLYRHRAFWHGVASICIGSVCSGRRLEFCFHRRYHARHDGLAT